MDYQNIRLDFEKQITEDLYDILGGKLIESILNEAKVEDEKNYLKQMYEGHAFKVSKELTPDIYNVFKKVKEILEFDEEVDFYISNSPDMNACSLTRKSEDDSHIISIYSGLLEKMSLEEVQFTLGHELGHIIINSRILDRLFSFLYAEREDVPNVLLRKYHLWEQLIELSADRFGFLAMPNLDVCVSSFFKLSSGLNTDQLKLNIKQYIKESKKILENFKENKYINTSTHPINPLRIEALILFRKSQIFKAISKNERFEVDNKLQSEMQELISILTVVSNTTLEYHRMFLLASAGLVMASVDEDLNSDEFEKILDFLSGYIMFPRAFLEKLHDEDINKIFIDSVKNILEINPGERINILAYLIHISIADKEITDKEIEFIFKLGTELLGFSKKEVAQHIASILQTAFMPNIYRI